MITILSKIVDLMRCDLRVNFCPVPGVGREDPPLVARPRFLVEVNKPREGASPPAAWQQTFEHRCPEHEVIDFLTTTEEEFLRSAKDAH